MLASLGHRSSVLIKSSSACSRTRPWAGFSMDQMDSLPATSTLMTSWPLQSLHGTSCRCQPLM
eukprot:427894-Amphidinium_carterae.1